MTKEKSNRQLRREKMKRNETRSRLWTIGLVVVGALFFAFVLIYPSLNRPPAAAIILPSPVTRPAASGMSLGDPKAPVKIEVFEDFQCPACRDFTQNIEPLVLKQLVETGKAYYVFRSYAFIDTNSPGQESHKAANAAMCANDQGKFWDYHDILFANWNGENKGTITNARLEDYGKSLNLDTTKFNSCVEDSTHANEVEASFNEGQSRGVTGTPTVFVKGKVVSPGYIPSVDDITAAVQAASAQP